MITDFLCNLKQQKQIIIMKLVFKYELLTEMIAIALLDLLKAMNNCFIYDL